MPDSNSTCDSPLPPLALEAIRLFNAGEYHAQHELLEDVCRAEPDPVRDVYQGVLQVGLAYYHIVEGNRRGALKMFKRAERWLAPLPTFCQGINIAQLREDAAKARDAVLRLKDGELDQFDRALLQPVKLVAPP
jgi:hypothetical protein